MQFGAKTLFSLFAAFLLVWLTLSYLLPLTAPFLLGLLLALAAEPMTRFLCKRLHLPRPVSAGICVSAAFCFLAMLLLLLGAFVVRELRNLAVVLPQMESAMESSISALQNWLLELSYRMPRSLQPMLQENTAALFSGSSSLLEQSVRYLLELAGSFLSHLPGSALTLGTAILSGFMFSAKLPKIRHWVLRQFPKERLRALLTAMKRMRHVAGGWLLAQLKLMGVTFCILFLGLLFLRIPDSFLWAAGISLVDAFPILGTGTILLPWALISLLQQKTAQAIGLVGIYATVSLIRSGLEPKLIARELDLDPLVTLMVMYVGFRLWGIGGMILAPVLTVTIVQLLPERKKHP